MKYVYIILVYLLLASGIAFAQEEYEDYEDYNDVPTVSKIGFLNTSGKLVIPCEYDNLEMFFTEGLAAIAKNEYYGYIDKTGKEVIPFIYEEAEPFLGGIARVEKNNKAIYIDKTGKSILPEGYTLYEEFINTENMISLNFDELEKIYDLLIVKDKNNKVGIINRQGELIVPCEYSGIYNTLGNILLAKKDKKYGYIDKTGKEIIPFVYDNATQFKDGMATVKKEDISAVIDETGTEIIPFSLNYENISILTNNLFLVQRNYKIGAISKTGITVIPCEYYPSINFGVDSQISNTQTKIEDTINSSIKSHLSLLNLVRKEENGSFLLFKDNQYYLFNSNGKGLNILNYDSISKYKENMAIVKKFQYYEVNIKDIYNDKRRQNITFDNYNDAMDYINSLPEEDFKNAVSPTETIAMPTYPTMPESAMSGPAMPGSMPGATMPGFETFNYSKNRQMFVSKIYTYGAIDENGNEIIPCIYSDLEDFENGYAVAKKGDYYGIISNKNGIAIPFEYDEICNFHCGLAKVAKANRYGFINKENKIIVPLKYQNVEDFNDNRAIVTLDDMSGVVDTKGNLIVDLKYDEIQDFYTGIAIVLKDDMCGMINKDGKEITPCIYGDIEDIFEDDPEHMLQDSNEQEFFLKLIGKLEDRLIPVVMEVQVTE